MKTKTPEKIAAGVTLGVVGFLGALSAVTYEAAENNRDIAEAASAVQDTSLAQEASYLAYEHQRVSDMFLDGAVLAGIAGAIAVGGAAYRRHGQQESMATVFVTPIERTVEEECFPDYYVARNQTRSIQTA